MKKNYLFSISFILISCLCCFQSFCQGSQNDSLLANSEKWKVQSKKNLMGLSRPVFGDYTTLDIIKLDSGRMKQKIKDSSDLSFELSGSGGSDWDQSKFLTIKKNRVFRLRLASKADTTKAIFSIASESKEKRQTFLGKILSKNDEGKNEELSYRRDIPGVIITNDIDEQWQFFIGDFSGGVISSISSGYLKNGKDSLTIQQYSSFNSNLVLVNTEGAHLAALKYKVKPFYIWIRNDLKPSYRQAIAAFFAVIIAVKDF